MLKTEKICKSYGAVHVLRDIDLSVDAGEVVALVGDSGAGKSTLLHILGTLSNPDRGKVYIQGRDVSLRSAREMASFRNKNIGFVFQFHNLLPEFSVLENAMMPGLIAGDDKAAVEARAMVLLERLGLSGMKDQKPAQLSGGEQQRTAVARALSNAPSLVLADEPSGNLDSRNARNLHQLFFDLKRDLGHTFVVATHNRELANMADRKVEIRDGVVTDS